MKKWIIMCSLFLFAGCSSITQREVSVQGYNGMITLRVHAQQGELLAIELMEHQETEAVVKEPLMRLIDEVIAAQSVEVEVISGATESCKAV